jgi:hypothetical protein
MVIFPAWAEEFARTGVGVDVKAVVELPIRDVELEVLSLDRDLPATHI